MKQEQKERIIKHGENLIKVFNLKDVDPLELCRKLHRLENKMHRTAEDYCNGVIDDNEYERKEEITLKSLDKILNFKAQKIPVIINGDPRGYALKIKSEYAREKCYFLEGDLGGYGIIAPDIN